MRNYKNTNCIYLYIKICQNKVVDLRLEVRDLMSEVEDLKSEVGERRSRGTPLNLTPGSCKTQVAEVVVRTTDDALRRVG